MPIEKIRCKRCYHLFTDPEWSAALANHSRLGYVKCPNPDCLQAWWCCEKSNCDAIFTRIANLRRHLKTHHPPPSTPPPHANRQPYCETGVCQPAENEDLSGADTGVDFGGAGSAGGSDIDAFAGYDAGDWDDCGDDTGDDLHELESLPDVDDDDDGDETIDDESQGDSPDSDEDEVVDVAAVAQEVDLLQLLEDDDQSIEDSDLDQPQDEMQHATDAVLYSLFSFPFFEDNARNRAWFWQNYIALMKRNKLVNSLQGLHKYEHMCGGLMGMCWRALHSKKHFGEQNTLPIADTARLFKMMMVAIKCFGELQEDVADLVCNEIESMTGGGTEAFGGDDDDEARTKRALEVLVKKKMSMLSNFPSPSLIIKDNHAMVESLDELMNMIIMSGIPVQYMETPTEYEAALQDEYRREHGPNASLPNQADCNLSSIAASDLLEELKDSVRSEAESDCLGSGEDVVRNTAYWSINAWSDGFERAGLKKKKKGCWMITIDFINPDGNSTSNQHTHVVALGRSNASHTAAVNHVLGQIVDLRKRTRRFCGITGKWIYTSIGLLSYSTDRVERSALLMTGHLGTFGMRSHWAAGMNELRLPVCNACFGDLANGFLNDPAPTFANTVCPRACCDRWDMGSATASTVELPKYYPKNRSNPDTGHAPKFRTVFMEEVKPYRQKFEWLVEGVTFAYKNACSTNRSTMWFKQNVRDFLRSMGVNKEVQEDVCRAAAAFKANPNSNLRFIPLLWLLGIPMHRFINSPMHLLFHGIIKDIMDFCLAFARSFQKGEVFATFVNERLSELESLGLDWCKQLEVPRTYWQAENFLALARVMPAIFGLFFEGGYIPERGATASKSVQQMLNSLHVMISALMSPRLSKDADKIDSYIKIFLSCCHRASIKVYGPSNRKKLIWIGDGNGKSNFVSLLNLPDQIRRYGPVRWYYEGRNERHIQVIKPHLIKNMRSTETYFKSKLDLYFKRKHMELIKSRLEPMRVKREDKHYCRYKSADDVRRKFAEGTPLSASVIEVANSMHTVIAFGGVNAMRVVTVSHDISESSPEICGMPCAACRLGQSSYGVSREDMKRWSVSQCLLLPRKLKGVAFNQEYAFVYSDWDVLDKTNSKGEALLSHMLFSTDVMQDQFEIMNEM
ncbi:hypothetical protein THAOC_17997 [Thalassiosira oceanica]|uniref:C2H2-type domain-containing protein n=1 Tax=Thalassiosira oceanica TaxID=159749 RepID=K0S990_THAOC|nr:hypothetical protein THAOC_17997 [Thalassiosira oceanica]|eukprot:EJK61504.1 hypothetical protein THAOC_17997 [Thalassiosira oceanica]